MVRYETVGSPEEPGGGAGGQGSAKLVQVFDRSLSPLDSRSASGVPCALRYLEAVEMTCKEVKDSISLHQAIVNGSSCELDAMYTFLMKEYEELNDRNSAKLKLLQASLNQQFYYDLNTIIQEGGAGQVEIVESVDHIEPNEAGTATNTDADQETST